MIYCEMGHVVDTYSHIGDGVLNFWVVDVQLDISVVALNRQSTKKKKKNCNPCCVLSAGQKAVIQIQPVFATDL